MINCILFNNGNFEEIKTKNLEESNIYKKCNFKKNKDFEKLFTWKNDDNVIELWGKNKGNIIKNIPKLFIVNNISIYSKSIFIKKDCNNKFISFNIDSFNNFFDINSVKNKILENENDEINENNSDLSDEDSLSDTENNDLEDSELSYEVYCYSDEE
jgi:hypothetical protein